MGNGAIKLNTIAICSVTFMSIAIFCWVVYAVLILLRGIPDEGGVENDRVNMIKKGFLGLGILFTFGSWISSLFNRTNWVPGTVGNWTNTIFWSAIGLTIIGGISMFFLFNETMRNEPKCRLVIILIFIIASWLLLIPDLMPEVCLPKS